MATYGEAGEAASMKASVTRDVLTCPRCGNNVMESVNDGFRTNFRCLLCWTCWHMELGALAVVDVRTCPGCKYAHECQSTPLPSPA